MQRQADARATPAEAGKSLQLRVLLYIRKDYGVASLQRLGDDALFAGNERLAMGAVHIAPSDRAQGFFALARFKKQNESHRRSVFAPRERHSLRAGFEYRIEHLAVTQCLAERIGVLVEQFGAGHRAAQLRQFDRGVADDRLTLALRQNADEHDHGQERHDGHTGRDQTAVGFRQHQAQHLAQGRR